MLHNSEHAFSCELFCRDERTVEGYHAKKQLSTFSRSSGDCFALTILPAVLKSNFDGTNVAMTPRYLHTTIARSV